MPKQKRPKHKLVVIDGEKRGREAPFGATKKQAAIYQEMRDVKNQIFDLETRYKVLSVLLAKESK